MPDGKTVTIHLGANRAATEILDCISDNLAGFLDSLSTRVVSRKEYVRHFRAAMTASNRTLIGENTSEAVLRAMTFLDNSQHIVLSEHALLGSMEEFFTERMMLPKAKRRAENISRTFVDCDINLHLAIAPQSNILVSTLADEAFFPDITSDSIPVHSWAALVSRITDGCPRAQVTVWNFENSDEVSLPFLASLLDLDVEYVDSLTRAELETRACRQLKTSEILSKIIKMDEGLLAKMDMQYEADLDHIEAMPRVSLVRK